MTDRPLPATRIPQGYPDFISSIKEQIRSAQIRAALSVNRDLVLLYWQIGKEILQRQESDGWGTKVIEQISRDLSSEFPEMKGFSSRNLKYMRKFAEIWSNEQFVQQLAAQIPWFHNCVILDQVSDPDEQEWYIRETIANGWSRSILVHQIESDLYNRQGKTVSNLRERLPAPQGELAQQIIKDPYNFDFLSLGKEHTEHDLHQGLIQHLRDFLIELGMGFAFVGSEYHLEVGGEDYYIDLLFYHLKLHCYVVIELKVVDFTPEFAGKLNFYLSAADDLLRDAKVDQSSIGILLCKTRNHVIAEYALRDMKKPIGISTYTLKKALPARMKGKLPTVEELEEELVKLGDAESRNVGGKNE
ncbi:MAG: PDDEXK nuclease domain-containing protein [Methanoregula sp.]|nr:PDDEXK nuclease domain-containing protein [Methanoregula sp.]